MNVDHHNANQMPIDSHLPQADPFSLVPTFKPSIWHNISCLSLPGVNRWVRPSPTHYFSLSFDWWICKVTKIHHITSVADTGCLSKIPDPDFYSSLIPDPGSRRGKSCLTFFLCQKCQNFKLFYLWTWKGKIFDPVDKDCYLLYFNLLGPS